MLKKGGKNPYPINGIYIINKYLYQKLNLTLQMILFPYDTQLLMENKGLLDQLKSLSREGELNSILFPEK